MIFGSDKRLERCGPPLSPKHHFYGVIPAISGDILPITKDRFPREEGLNILDPFICSEIGPRLADPREELPPRYNKAGYSDFQIFTHQSSEFVSLTL